MTYDQQIISENYPSGEEIANIEKRSEWLPKYLHLLMKSDVNSKTKDVSIERAIVQITRQKSCSAFRFISLDRSCFCFKMADYTIKSFWFLYVDGVMQLQDTCCQCWCMRK